MLQPVNKLPSELISHIAQYFLQTRSNTRRIVPLTHVCQYWRESIITTPANWTLISSSRADLAALSLKRSKDALLQLQLDTASVKRDHEFRDLIAPYIQNIETLLFDGLEAIEDLTQILPNFPQSTPNLRTLVLGTLGGEPGWDPSADPFELFPDTLRSLTLYDIPLYPSFLKLKTLTKLSLNYYTDLTPLETVLDFLEGNQSLENVDLVIDFPTWMSRGRTVILGRLRHLSITSSDVLIAGTLISRIPLQGGAHLEVSFRDNGRGMGLYEIMHRISLAPLIPPPTFMEYGSLTPMVRLVGPNGSFSYHHEGSRGVPFDDLCELPLANIRELRLAHRDPSIEFHPPSFPVLETLTVQNGTDVSHLFSALFPNPSFPPYLKTLGFLDCDITEEFMEELSQFASDRKKTTSAWLHRVVIVHQEGKFPSVASIRELEKHIPIVDVQFGRILPTNLT